MVYVMSLLLLGMMTEGVVSVQADSTKRVTDIVGPRTGPERDGGVVRLLLSRTAPSDNILLSLRHVRLEMSPPIDEASTATLKFEVHNEGAADVADIELSISLLGPPIKAMPTRREPLVRPFSIRLNTVLLAGHILNYEIRLRNISAECDCIPKFQLVDARAVANSGR